MKFNRIKSIGPGLLVAAAGIGAGDMIIAIQTGLDFNLLFVVTIVLTCLVKYVLTEGIARYQLSSGHSVISAWITRFPTFFRYLFFIFFLIWSVMVSAALMSACGIAAHALSPAFSVSTWGVMQSMVTFFIIYFGKYGLIEKITKWLIGLMFLVVMFTAVYLLLMGEERPTQVISQVEYARSTLLFAILGGVGGSVTMLSYGYWLKERGWQKAEHIQDARFDLFFSYFITGLFVLAVMYISSVLRVDGATLKGSAMVLGIADLVGASIGPAGSVLFKIGFWGVVFSSMITVWSGVPYIFSDFMLRRKSMKNQASLIQTNSTMYRSYLAFITLVPMVLTLWFDAVRNVINYTLISTLFVFGLAVTLLILNNSRNADTLKNDVFTNLVLMVAILAFALMGVYSFL